MVKTAFEYNIGLNKEIQFFIVLCSSICFCRCSYTKRGCLGRQKKQKFEQQANLLSRKVLTYSKKGVYFAMD